MVKKGFKIGIVGATGLVGGELIERLCSENFPVSELRLFSSIEDAGEKIEFLGDEIVIEPIRSDYYKGLELVFFASHPMVSRDLAESAVKNDVWVIDCSRYFRREPGVLLVVPEVNGFVLDEFKSKPCVLVSPSPTAIAVSLVLFPIIRRVKLRRVIATSAHSSTEAGKKGFEELQSQVIAIFNQSEIKVEKFPRQVAFNIFPKVGEFEGRETDEEKDLRFELEKILGISELAIDLSSMRVPLFCGLAISVFLELEKNLELEELRMMLSSQAGLKLVDNPEKEEYPDSLLALEEKEVIVGRIRKAQSIKNGFSMWIFIDNLAKGSSLNMIQIARKVLE